MPESSCQTSAFSGRSMPMVCACYISGVPPLALPKIRRSVGCSRRSTAACAGGVIEVGKYHKALGLHFGFEPFHGLFRPKAALDGHQSVCGHRLHSAQNKCVAAIGVLQALSEGLTAPTISFLSA